MPPLLACVSDAVGKVVEFLDLYDLIAGTFCVSGEQYESETRARLISVPEECQKSLERLCWYIRAIASDREDPQTEISQELRLVLSHVVTVEDRVKWFAFKVRKFLERYWELNNGHDDHEEIPDWVAKEDDEMTTLLDDLKMDLLKFLALTLGLTK
jgi:hypothetical protein